LTVIITVFRLNLLRLGIKIFLKGVIMAFRKAATAHRYRNRIM